MSRKNSSSRTSKLGCHGRTLLPADPSLDVAEELFLPQMQAWMSRKNSSSGRCKLGCHGRTLPPADPSFLASVVTNGGSRASSQWEDIHETTPAGAPGQNNH